MKVNLCTGYPLSSPKGNSVTALRLQRLLQARGIDAKAMHTDQPPSADALIALHAIKTSAATLQFSEQHPDASIWVVLTGTDLYGGMAAHPALAERVLRAATGLVVAQSESRQRLDERWRRKTVVIFPSVELPELATVLPPSDPLFTCVGHLRPVKNPHRLFEALQLIQDPVAAWSIGADLSISDGQQARVNMRADPRYRWIGECSRSEALGWMRASLATINSSYSEGGANTVVEAIRLGVPVLASRIDGNVGLLGTAYEGFFEPDRSDQLAELMQRCLHEPALIAELKSQLAEVQHRYTADAEIDAWVRLLHRGR